MKNNISLPPFFSAASSLEFWEKQRRNEIIDCFSNEVYGVTPTKYQTEFIQGDTQEAVKAGGYKQEITVKIKAEYGEYKFPFLLYTPKKVIAPPPVFLFISIWDKKETAERLPLSYILSRGFAVALLYTSDVDTDCDDGFINGIERIFEKDLQNRKKNAMAAIGSWAFGASRVLDFLIQDKRINGAKTIVVGHSRGGKTALWAGAQDKRFYGTISNNSGCTGAAASKIKDGEQIRDINTTFPYWFCENYRKYNENPALLPVDQHMLLALIAPRHLYVASASEDSWADPDAERFSLINSFPIYTLYGEKVPNLDAVTTNLAIKCEKIGFHLRKGEHDITEFDWELFIDFFEQSEI